MPSEIGLRRYIPYKDEVSTTDSGLSLSDISEIIDYINNGGDPSQIPDSGESSGLPDDMPDDYEGDVTELDIAKMLEDDTSEGLTDG